METTRNGLTMPKTIDEALRLIFSNDGWLVPYSIKRGEETITVVPLPSIGEGKGICALVVYPNGRTERYEQITLLSNGAAVALVSGRIMELMPPV